MLKLTTLISSSLLLITFMFGCATNGADPIETAEDTQEIAVAEPVVVGGETFLDCLARCEKEHTACRAAADKQMPEIVKERGQVLAALWLTIEYGVCARKHLTCMAKCVTGSDSPEAAELSDQLGCFEAVVENE